MIPRTSQKDLKEFFPDHFESFNFVISQKLGEKYFFRSNQILSIQQKNEKKKVSQKFFNIFSFCSEGLPGF